MKLFFYVELEEKESKIVKRDGWTQTKYSQTNKTNEKKESKSIRIFFLSQRFEMQMRFFSVSSSLVVVIGLEFMEMKKRPEKNIYTKNIFSSIEDSCGYDE